MASSVMEDLMQQYFRYGEAEVLAVYLDALAEYDGTYRDAEWRRCAAGLMMLKRSDWVIDTWDKKRVEHPTFLIPIVEDLMHPVTPNGKDVFDIRRKVDAVRMVRCGLTLLRESAQTKRRDQLHSLQLTHQSPAGSIDAMLSVELHMVSVHVRETTLVSFTTSNWSSTRIGRRFGGRPLGLTRVTLAKLPLI